MEKFLLYAFAGVVLSGPVVSVTQNESVFTNVNTCFSITQGNAAMNYISLAIAEQDKPKLKKVKKTKPGPVVWRPSIPPSTPIEGDQSPFSKDDFDFFGDYMDPALINGAQTGLYIADGEIGADDNYYVYFFDAKTNDVLAGYVFKE